MPFKLGDMIELDKLTPEQMLEITKIKYNERKGFWYVEKS